MKKLSATEIIEKLKEFGLTVENFAFEEFSYSEEHENKLKKYRIDNPDYWRNSDKEYNKLLEKANDDLSKRRADLGIEWKEVYQKGGEGEGDHWESVKYFPEHDVYLRVIGYYQSHYGTDFDDWEDAVKEVKPVEKTITVYQ